MRPDDFPDRECQFCHASYSTTQGHLCNTVTHQQMRQDAIQAAIARAVLLRDTTNALSVESQEGNK